MHGNSPRNRRRKIGTQYKRVSVPVKKLIQFIGRCGADIASKHVKIFYGRRIDVFIAVITEHIVEPVHQFQSFASFRPVQIPEAFRCMDHSALIHFGKTSLC